MNSPGVEGHGWVGGVLSQVEEGGAPQLFLNDESLFQQFESSGQKLVFNFQEISFSDIHLDNLSMTAKFKLTNLKSDKP